jgi:catechol 2,3-dioxygenase-like lactoylglutathione lyase family enzyme
VPLLDGRTHVRLTVADLERSAAWYSSAFELVPVGPASTDDGSSFTGRMLLHPRSFASVVLAQAASPVPGPFDERRVGLHHLAFHVPDRADLDDFARHFDTLRLEHSGVRTSKYEPGLQIWLRDPDNIWLEVYWVDREQFIANLRRRFRARRGRAHG